MICFRQVHVKDDEKEEDKEEAAALEAFKKEGFDAKIVAKEESQQVKALKLAEEVIQREQAAAVAAVKDKDPISQRVKVTTLGYTSLHKLQEGEEPQVWPDSPFKLESGFATTCGRREYMEDR